MSLEEMERQLIEATLEHYAGHRARTAKALGIGIRTLCGKLRQYGYAPREKSFAVGNLWPEGTDADQLASQVLLGKQDLLRQNLPTATRRNCRTRVTKNGNSLKSGGKPPHSKEGTRLA